MDSMLHVPLDPPATRYAAPELPGPLNCEFWSFHQATIDNLHGMRQVLHLYRFPNI
jgi:hypothetical protein